MTTFDGWSHKEQLIRGMLAVEDVPTRKTVLRFKIRGGDQPMTDNLIVVNRADQFIGLLPLRTLLVSDPAASVREMMAWGEEHADQLAAAGGLQVLREEHGAPKGDG